MMLAPLGVATSACVCVFVCVCVCARERERERERERGRLKKEVKHERKRVTMGEMCTLDAYTS